MPKEFYTERDIEDMVKRGVLTLELNDHVVLTDLAYEKANKLGMRLVRDKPANPPGAPVRPYIAMQVSKPVTRTEPAAYQFSSPSAQAAEPVKPPVADGTDLRQRIHDAVVAKLGSQVDAALLDVIITRVLNSTGVK